VLASRGDTLVDPDCSRQLAHAWRAEISEHASAGHDVCLDDGPWVAQQLRGWLERAAGPAPSIG
jgi:predicted alpha/beta hydrolase family esterase